MRIDKFIWNVRLFKTRRLATEACQKERIMIGNNIVKPAKPVSINDTITVQHTGIKREFKVLDLPKNRLGAKLVEQYIEEVTSAEELQKLKQIQEMNRQNYLSGIKGRPTKKDRRDLDDFHGA